MSYDKQRVNELFELCAQEHDNFHRRMSKIEKVIAWPFYFLALILGAPAIALSLIVAYFMDFLRNLVERPFSKRILNYQKEISEILDDHT